MTVFFMLLAFEQRWKEGPAFKMNNASKARPPTSQPKQVIHGASRTQLTVLEVPDKVRPQLASCDMSCEW